MKLILSGIFIHLIFMGAIFDVYFKSPILTGLQSQKNERTPPAKRLILIVADGLRAESLFGRDYSDFNYMLDVSPYLSQKIVSSRTAWGISHTRVPTESRPGHVAITAGIYEDPSAIAKGWKENPVEFDSVFNESLYTWAWGSPDIVPMFKKSPNVEGYSYSSEEEDFSGKIATQLLDDWVFDHFFEFLTKNHSDTELKKLKSGEIIFFLHLLGLDTAGHTHKPGSEKHASNIEAVDNGIIRIEKAVYEFYHDNDTVFIFTADHGMTDWGSHGAGSAHETETPFIAWGAGIKSSKKSFNITQADIAPLISTLIGIPIPVNSIGVLPTSILDMNEEEIAHALYLNAKQIYAQFEQKRRRTESTSIWLLYKPYPHLFKQEFENIISVIESSFKDKDYKYVIKSCEGLIRASIEGLDYYQNYYQRLLLICISMAYLGWIGILLIHLTEPLDDIFVPEEAAGKISNFIRRAELYIILHVVFFFAIILTWILLYVQSLPFMYYIYCTLPIYIWWHIFEKTDEWFPRIQDICESYEKMYKIFGGTILYLLGVETLVLSFFYRESLSLSLFIIALRPYYWREIHLYLKIAWSLTCVALAIFPFMPVIGSNFNIFLIAITAVLWILALFSSLILNHFTRFRNEFFIDRNHIIMAVIQSLFLAVAVFNLYSIDASMSNKQGLTWYNQWCSWILSGISLIVSICGPNMIFVRLSNIAMGLLVPFILLSVSYEPLFLLVLFANLLMWLRMEHEMYGTLCKHLSAIPFTNIKRRFSARNRSVVQTSDFRRGFFIVVYAVLAFFGLGNMASINSFDPMWTRNFITIFSPFIMTSLILFKTLVPYLIVSCVFRAVTTILQAPVKKMFFIVLMFCDIMGLHFLFLVRNTGSWLEIGSSISHYIIVQTMALFLLLLYVLAIPLTNSDILGLKKNIPIYSYKVHRR